MNSRARTARLLAGLLTAACLGAHAAAPVSDALPGAAATSTITPSPVPAVVPAIATRSAEALYGSRLSGQQISYQVVRGDSLSSLAARNGQSASLIARTNGLSARAQLQPGQLLVLDNRHVVPDSAEDGLLINVPQRMLFLFADGALAAVHPVTAGRHDWRTPLGPFTVINRQTDKPWFVPKSIQEEMAREGKPVLTRVEPGPDNPLGRHWIGLSMPAIGIHGTNAPMSIYALRSHGCVRMHPDDIASLFEQVRVDTPGRIVYHPTLLAVLDDGRVFVEVNPDAYRLGPAPMAALRALAEQRGITDHVDWDQAQLVANAREGIAREVTFRPIAASAPAIPLPSSNSPMGDPAR